MQGLSPMTTNSGPDKAAGSEMFFILVANCWKVSSGSHHWFRVHEPQLINSWTGDCMNRAQNLAELLEAFLHLYNSNTTAKSREIYEHERDAEVANTSASFQLPLVLVTLSH